MAFSLREILLTVRCKAAEVGRSPVRLLLAAALLHLALTVTVYALGRYEVFPGAFDRNGIGVSFAADGLQHRADTVALSNALAHGDVLGWLKAPAALHLKLYSLCFALLGPLLGLNILSIEPLNAFYYLLILALVFNLGREVFNRRVGLLAAAVVALWPSFLLHTTQPLKDPLFVAGMLAFILVITRYLTRNCAWREAALTGLAGGVAAAALWLARDNMWDVVVVTALLGAGLLLIRQFMERRVQIANLAGMALLIALTFTAQQVLPEASKAGRVRAFAGTTATGKLPAGGVGGASPTTSAKAPASTFWSRLARHVGAARYGFTAKYSDAGSNIDSGVQLTSMSELIRYLPRATAIGFFAPFPNMWGGVGKQVGGSGRLLAGLECLIMYAIEALALYGLWQGRRRLPIWLLFLVAAMGIIALGLVVVNVGALFRMRYVFLMLLMILGADGALNILSRFVRKTAEAKEAGAEA